MPVTGLDFGFDVGIAEQFALQILTEFSGVSSRVIGIGVAAMMLLGLRMFIFGKS